MSSFPPSFYHLCWMGISSEGAYQLSGSYLEEALFYWKENPLPQFNLPWLDSY